MKIILDFLSTILIKDSKLLLGRWSINYCHNIINKKIDSGNEDHCGPCGKYNLGNKLNIYTDIPPNSNAEYTEQKLHEIKNKINNII